MLTLTACSNTGEQSLDLIPDGFNGLSVSYLDMGYSDAIFIKFPNGKTMLIDSGEYTENNSAYLNAVLTKYATRIDYLVLSNPADKNLGNASMVVQNFQVGQAFVPTIKNRSLFIKFNAVYQTLVSKGTTIKESNYTCSFQESDCFIAFLAPVVYGYDGSAYNNLNLSAQPDIQTVYSVSAVIYLEYNGVRFLFTADAGSETEQLILQNYESDLYDVYFGKDKVNLTAIDFLKVGRNGANDGTSAEFLSVVKPLNAVISVGENYYGHPARAVLNRLQESSSEISFYRTDLNGTVTTLVSPNGRYTVKTSN